MTKAKLRKRPTAQPGAKLDRLPSLEVLRKLHGEPPPARSGGVKPARADLQRLYVRERRSIRDVAGLLGCSKDAVCLALSEYGIQARPRGEKRSALQDVPLARLLTQVERLGLRGAARELGVDHGNLARHLKARRGA